MSVYVVCTYPVSGQYELPQRSLYYFLLCFALIFRSYSWLSAGALGVALTYSGAAAIHGIILTLHHGITQQDPDTALIFLILSTAALLTAPLLSWSSKIRQVDGRAILTAWLLLIAAGTIATIIPQTAPNIRADAPLECSFNASECRPVYVIDVRKSDIDQMTKSYFSQLHHALPHIPRKYYGFDQESWKKCKCSASCETVASDRLFRAGRSSSMVPDLRAAKSIAFAQLSTSKQNLIYGCIVTITFLQLAIGIVFQGKSPRQLRHWLFKRIRTSTPSSSSDATFCCRMQNDIAKWTAFGGYIFNCASLLICPPALFFLIIEDEMHQKMTSQDSESYGAVGQWAPWVQIGLALIGVSISRYHIAWWRFLSHRWAYLKHKLSPARYPESSASDRKSSALDQETKVQLVKIFHDLKGFAQRPFVLVIDEIIDMTTWLKDHEMYENRLEAYNASLGTEATLRSSVVPQSAIGPRDNVGNFRITIRQLPRRHTL